MARSTGRPDPRQRQAQRRCRQADPQRSQRRQSQRAQGLRRGGRAGRPCGGGQPARHHVRRLRLPQPPPVPFSPLTFPLLRYPLCVLDESGQTARLEFPSATRASWHASPGCRGPCLNSRRAWSITGYGCHDSAICAQCCAQFVWRVPTITTGDLPCASGNAVFSGS